MTFHTVSRQPLKCLKVASDSAFFSSVMVSFEGSAMSVSPGVLSMVMEETKLPLRCAHRVSSTALLPLRWLVYAPPPKNKPRKYEKEFSDSEKR